MLRILALIFLGLFSYLTVVAQKQNAIWCFGDSAGIDFNNINNPISISTALRTRGSCASIADSNGQLLFYANTRATVAGNTTLIWNKNHQLMQDGDSIVGRGWYGELLTVKNPVGDSTYYLFSIGVTSIYGFYYSIVDMSLNGGLGVVTQKNVMLDSVESVDYVIGIKHGNGRDWWIIFRRNDYNMGSANNDFYEYLVTPLGVSNVQIVSCGTPNPTGFNRFCVSSDGTKIASVNTASLVEVYSFDRCTGSIYNPITIEPQASTFPYIEYWECAFSPDGNKLYVTTNDSTCVLLQYNLLDSNPALTKDTLWQTTFPLGTMGAVRRALDNKLYLSSAYYNGFTWNYPYPDSMYNMYNMNLSVINQPDSLGAACDFQPYSFYLGGKRTYWGLPNNPDYDLGRDSGSVCDTIQWAGVNEQEATGKGQLFVTYINSWEKLFVNAQHLKGKQCTLQIFDMNGRKVFSSSKQTAPPYYTESINCAAFSKGMYVVHLMTEKETLSKKFVKE